MAAKDIVVRVLELSRACLSTILIHHYCKWLQARLNHAIGRETARPQAYAV